MSAAGRKQTCEMMKKRPAEAKRKKSNRLTSLLNNISLIIGDRSSRRRHALIAFAATDDQIVYANDSGQIIGDGQRVDHAPHYLTRGTRLPDANCGTLARTFFLGWSWRIGVGCSER